GGTYRIGKSPPAELVEAQRQSVGQDGDLRLLEDDSDQPLPFAGLEEERAGPGPTDRSGGEALWLLEEEDPTGHRFDSTPVRRGSPSSGKRAPRGPQAATVGPASRP